MHTTPLSACLGRFYSNLARKVYKNQPKGIIMIISNILIV